MSGWSRSADGGNDRKGSGEGRTSHQFSVSHGHTNTDTVEPPKSNRYNSAKVYAAKVKKKKRRHYAAKGKYLLMTLNMFTKHVFSFLSSPLAIVVFILKL